MKISGLSDCGMVRKSNQDTYGFRETASAYFGAVCDGMGGSAAGNKASALAIKRILDSLEAQIKPGLTDSDVKSVLRGVIRSANLYVYDTAATNKGLEGMGTTVVAFVYVKELDTLFIVNVGDSRAYLIRAGRITQITCDHSLVYEMVARGHITREEARTHPSRNIITRALGTDTDLLADTFNLSVEEGDMLLLCSDGLHGMLSEEEILSLIEKSGEDVDVAAEELVNRANLAGGSDNITVLVALFDKEGGGAV